MLNRGQTPFATLSHIYRECPSTDKNVTYFRCKFKNIVAQEIEQREATHRTIFMRGMAHRDTHRTVAQTGRYINKSNDDDDSRYEHSS